MKTMFFVFTLAFFVAMFVRIVEMSLEFDWVDILWAGVFLIGSIFCGALFSLNKDEDW